MKVADIRAYKDAELAKELEAAHKELFDLRFKLATKQLVNNRELPRARKKIAQLRTVIRERELEIR